MVRALGREGHEAAAAVQQALGQAHEEQRFRVLCEELSLLAQRLGAAAVVGACSNQANAEDGLERGDFVSVVSKTRQRLEHFRLGVGNVEHGHSHRHYAAEGGVAKLKGKQNKSENRGVRRQIVRSFTIEGCKKEGTKRGESPEGADLQHAIQQATRHFASHFFTENGGNEADGSHSLLSRAAKMAIVSRSRRSGRCSCSPSRVDVSGRSSCRSSCGEARGNTRDGSTGDSSTSSSSSSGGGFSIFFLGSDIAVLGADVHEFLNVDHVARACVSARSHLRDRKGLDA